MCVCVCCYYYNVSHSNTWRKGDRDVCPCLLGIIGLSEIAGLECDRNDGIKVAVCVYGSLRRK